MRSFAWDIGENVCGVMVISGFSKYFQVIDPRTTFITDSWWRLFSSPQVLIKKKHGLKTKIFGLYFVLLT